MVGIKKYKVLSFQSFSVYSNGGGSRILRRLFSGREDSIISIALVTHKVSLESNKIKEIVLHAEPISRWWIRGPFRKYALWLRHNLFFQYTVKKVYKVLMSIDYDILHIVDQGIFSSSPLIYHGKSNNQLWVSFHDHYQPNGGNIDNTKKLWLKANRRLVISKELGEEYSRIFGNLPYEMITDGILSNEINHHRNVISKKVVIYFAGLLHIDYLPLFYALADALNHLLESGMTFKFVLRGTQEISYFNDKKVDVEYRPFTVDDNSLLEELNEADILYLPMKFTDSDFYRFSLSTKMISYLAAPGAILYHGPFESAACKLLVDNEAAICCDSLNVEDIQKSILLLIENYSRVSSNATLLAQKRFDMNIIRKKFWS